MPMPRVESTTKTAMNRTTSVEMINIQGMTCSEPISLWFPPLSLTVCLYLNIEMNMPAAAAEPMTPARFGPIACINRKFDGFA
jgi:hypothetical protein